MALELAIFKQKVPPDTYRLQPIKFHYLQVLAFNNFFLYKTQKQPIINLPSQFQIYFTY